MARLQSTSQASSKFLSCLNGQQLWVRSPVLPISDIGSFEKRGVRCCSPDRGISTCKGCPACRRLPTLGRVLSLSCSTVLSDRLGNCNSEEALEDTANSPAISLRASSFSRAAVSILGLHFTLAGRSTPQSPESYLTDPDSEPGSNHLPKKRRKEVSFERRSRVRTLFAGHIQLVLVHPTPSIKRFTEGVELPRSDQTSWDGLPSSS